MFTLKFRNHHCVAAVLSTAIPLAVPPGCLTCSVHPVSESGKVAEDGPRTCVPDNLDGDKDGVSGSRFGPGADLAVGVILEMKQWMEYLPPPITLLLK